MGKGRLEAFTDGVVAIIITIMVLEVKVPQGGGLAGILEQLPVFSAYVLSYITIGIFWNNHHHMLHATERIDGRVLWANMGLLFALCNLWGGADNGSDRLQPTGTRHHCLQRPHLEARRRDRP